MIKQKSQILCAWFRVWDLVTTGLAWVLAYHVRFDSGLLPIDKETPGLELCCANLPLVLVLGARSPIASPASTTSTASAGSARSWSAVLKGTALMALLVIAATFVLHDPYESRATMLLFFGLTVVGILAVRRASWVGVRWLRSRGYNQTHALIVGTGRVARKTARSLRRRQLDGHQERRLRRGPADPLDRRPRHPRHHRRPARARSTSTSVGHVFIALPLSRYDDARRVFDMLSQTLVEVRLVADVPDLAGLSLTTTNLDGLPMIGLRESPHFGLNIVVKRAMDIVLSAGRAGRAVAAAGCRSPLLVKLTSPGPIFYRQERCGLNGQSFQMLKFRSMRVDAEQQTGAGLGAARTTRGGRGSGRSCGRPASTSCRSSSTC